jgi:hypothetical protein
MMCQPYCGFRPREWSGQAEECEVKFFDPIHERWIDAKFYDPTEGTWMDADFIALALVFFSLLYYHAPIWVAALVAVGAGCDGRIAGIPLWIVILAVLGCALVGSTLSQQ